MRIAGVDGSPSGWVVALLEDGELTFTRADHAGELADLADLICIDIPIGLPERGRRALEAEVRRRLPGRGSTVFPTPARAVLAEAPPQGDYRRACDLSQLLCDGRGISKQTWFICAKIAEVDDVLAATPGLDERVAEAHPELAFATMAGGEPAPPKRTAAGARHRRELLNAWAGREIAFPSAKDLGARPDDVLDAAALAWVGQRWAAGEADVILDDAAPRDPTGRPMRIVC